MLKKDIVVEKMTGQSIINKKLRGLIIINGRYKSDGVCVQNYLHLHKKL